MRSIAPVLMGVGESGTAKYHQFGEAASVNFLCTGGSGTSKTSLLQQMSASLLTPKASRVGERYEHKPSLVCIDPKGCAFLCEQLKLRAEMSGRNFHSIDLRGQLPQINPLRGLGSNEIFTVFDKLLELSDSGRDSDHYHGIERDQLQAFSYFVGDGGLAEQLRYRECVEKFFDDCYGETKTIQSLRRKLRELDLPVFRARTGIDLPDAIEAGDVVLVRGSPTKTSRASLAQKLLLGLINCHVVRRDPEKSKRLVIALDELGLQMSPLVVEMLRVVRSQGAVLWMFTQSISDCGDCGSANYDTQVLQDAFLTNVANKAAFRCADVKTAEYYSALSGMRKGHVETLEVSRTEWGHQYLTGDSRWSEVEIPRFDLNQLFTLSPQEYVFFDGLGGSQILRCAPPKLQEFREFAPTDYGEDQYSLPAECVEVLDVD